MSSFIETSLSTEAPPSLARSAAVLVPGGALALLAVTFAGVAQAPITTDLDMGAASGHWIATLYLLAAGIGIPLSGWAAIRFGVRATWLVALGTFVLAAAAAAVAPGPAALLVARAFQGLAGGALEPIMLTALARAAGPERMGRVMGSVAAVMAIAPLAGPPLGGVVVDQWGWRAIFALTAAAGAVVLAASFVALTRDARVPARLDLLGLVLLAATSASILFGLSRLGARGGIDAVVALALGAGIAAGAGFVWWARRLGGRAIVDLATFRQSSFRVCVLIMALLGGAIYPLFFGLPQFYQGVAGLDPTTSGLLMIPYGAGTLVAMSFAGRLNDHISARILVPAGAMVSLGGFAGLVGSDAGTSTVVFALTTAVIGLGIGFIGGPTVSTLYRDLPEALVPAGSTTLFVVNQLGGATGVALLAVVLGAGTAWTADIGTAPLWIPLGATAAIGLLALALPRNATQRS
ncbi:MFS transporter [Rhodococcus rhodnii]|uniref:Multidrug efflux transport protein n=2 Tax=Rhodococcus rhodnii TaxID=38312 RepID=R7WH04_9NOCA|nr:MFS transporter [Rhodococcus rhodnii]EOM74425.1 multidrug efflux transport protein [Rhodococcus rhodnii LMG 5362]